MRIIIFIFLFFCAFTVSAQKVQIVETGQITNLPSVKTYKFVANANNVTDVDVTAASPANGSLVQGSTALLSADLTNAHTNPNFEVWINGLKYNVKNSVVSTATNWAEGYVVFTGNSIAAYVSNNGTPNSKITINQIEIKK